MSERIKAFKELVDVTEIQGPDRRMTAQIPKPLQIETLLKDVLKETIETRDAVHTLTNTVTAVAQDVSVLKAAREADELARKRHSGAISAVSGTAKKVSENDLKQDAAIAQVVIDVTDVKNVVTAMKTDLANNSRMTSQVLAKVLIDKAGGFLKANPTLEKAFVGFLTALLILLTFLATKYSQGH